MYPFFKRIQKQICITVLQRTRTFFLFFRHAVKKIQFFADCFRHCQKLIGGDPLMRRLKIPVPHFSQHSICPVRWHLQNKFFLKLCQLRLFLKTFFLIFFHRIFLYKCHFPGQQCFLVCLWNFHHRTMFFSHSETKSLIFFFHDPLCLRFRQKIQNSSFYAFQQNSAAFRKPFPICLAGQQDPEAVVSDVAPDPAFHIHPFFFFGHFCIHHQITELI